MKNLDARKVKDLVTMGKHLCEQHQTLSAIDGLRFLCEEFIKDKTHSLEEEVVPNVTYGMVLGCMIVAEAELAQRG